MNTTKRLVIIPTFNEVESIASLLDKLKTLNLDVLIVDDGSIDGTTDVVSALKLFDDKCFEKARKTRPRKCISCRLFMGNKK